MNDDHLHNRLNPTLPTPTSPHGQHRLYSIANNMTSQAMSPSTKTPLSDLENSYQNIKHKMPVNQHINQSIPLNTRKHVLTDQKRKYMAACQIQRWFRRHHVRTQAGQAALKRLLERTKSEHVEGAVGTTHLQASIDKSTEDRKRVREERARQARQFAIKVRVARRRCNEEVDRCMYVWQRLY